MMRAGICCLLLVLCASVGHADDAEKSMKFYSWWDGNWDVELKHDGEVEKFIMKITRPSPNVHLVEGFGVGLWGFDPKRKRWVGTGFTSDGSFFTTILKGNPGEVVTPGTKQEATTTSKNPDGSVEKGKEIWTYVDADTATVVAKMTNADGKESSFEHFYKRRK
jgi:hypothetical protein